MNSKSMLKELYLENTSASKSFLNEGDRLIIPSIFSRLDFDSHIPEKLKRNIHSLCRKIHINKKVRQYYKKDWSLDKESPYLSSGETLALITYLLYIHKVFIEDLKISLKILNAALFLLELSEEDIRDSPRFLELKKITALTLEEYKKGAV